MTLRNVVTALIAACVMGCGSGIPAAEHAHASLETSGEELSSEDQEHVDYSEAELAKVVTETNEACGTDLAVTVDWASFAGTPWRDMSLYSYCGDALEELDKFCDGPAAKAYIQANVQRFECSFGGEGARALSFEQGTIRYKVDFEGGNNDEFARSALLAEL